MSNSHPIPEGNTDEAIEFLERMYPKQLRHLVAIDENGRITARIDSSRQGGSE